METMVRHSKEFGFAINSFHHVITFTSTFLNGRQPMLGKFQACCMRSRIHCFLSNTSSNITAVIWSSSWGFKKEGGTSPLLELTRSVGSFELCRSNSYRSWYPGSISYRSPGSAAFSQSSHLISRKMTIHI